MQIRNPFILSFIFVFLTQFGYSIEKHHLSSKEDVSKYLSGRIETSDKRYPSFLMALELLKERKAKVFVETGTARYGDQQYIGDGGSTIIFGDWATQHHATLHSVDMDSAAIEKAKSVTKGYVKNINFCLSDSIEFLREFPQFIDFLYLDSYEYNSSNPLPSQTHHLNEMMAAYPILHEKSVVMVDDCDLPEGGQGKFVIEFLTERGWKVIFKGYQTILVQDQDHDVEL